MIGYTCADCNRELICIMNDVMLVHFMNDDREQGIDAIRYGDLYECPKCRTKTVMGLGQGQTLGYEITKENQKKIMESDRMIEVKRGD